MIHFPNLQVGTFVLNIELLVYVLAGSIGALAVRYRMRAHPERAAIVSVAWNAVILWVILWKGSLLIFDLKNVIANPLSLLVFSGGMKGVWLASVVAIGYMGMRYAKWLGRAGAAKTIAIWVSGGLTGLGAAAMAFTDAPGLYAYAALLIPLAVFVVLLSPSLRFSAQALSVLLILTMVAYTVFNPGDGGGGGARDDQAAPDFQTADLNGNAVSLSDYRGQVVLMNFWTTWCQICKAEMPHIEKLYQTYKDQNVAIIAVNVTSQEKNTQAVGKYVEKYGLSFPVMLDEAGSIARQYRVSAYPTTYLIGPDGKLLERYLGAISYENMSKAIRSAGEGTVSDT